MALVRVNEQGRRIGESHRNARHSDADVERAIAAYEVLRSYAKEAPVRSETYRRAVASLPCAICGVHGYSQAAHANQGKGMGMKACDLTCFPACGPRPGIQGCHAALDQGALFTKAVRRELEPVWAADTQRKIQAMGLWPKGLPLKNFTTGDDFELTRKNRT